MSMISLTENSFQELTTLFLSFGYKQTGWNTTKGEKLYIEKTMQTIAGLYMDSTFIIVRTNLHSGDAGTDEYVSAPIGSPNGYPIPHDNLIYKQKRYDNAEGRILIDSISGKFITKPFIPFTSGIHAGKHLTKITINGKTLTLSSKPVFKPNPHMSSSSDVADGLEINGGSRNTWHELNGYSGNGHMVKGGSWSTESSWQKDFGDNGSNDYSKYINAKMTLHLFYSGTSTGNKQYEIPLAQFSVNDHQTLYGHIYIRQHNGVLQLYIHTGGRFKITRWDIS